MQKIKIIFTLILCLLLISGNNYSHGFKTKGPEVYISPVDPLCANEKPFKLQVDTPGGIWSGNGITDSEEGVFDPEEAGAGEHHITYLIFNEEDTTSAETVITVYEMPEINVTRNPYTGCAPITMTFNNDVDQSGYTYNWGFYDSETNLLMASSLKQVQVAFNEVGDYRAKLNVSSENGCKDSVNVIIHIHEKPKADFIAFPWKVGLFDARISFEDMSTHAAVWEWNFGDGTISNKQHPSHIYYEPGDYDVKLTILNQYLCSDTVSKTVSIVEDHKVYFPEAINLTSFENSKFQPKGVGIDTDYYELSVYSRFGDLVFYTNDFYTAWEGKFKNNKGDYVPQGQYTYISQIRDLRGVFHVYSGTISVFR